MTSINEHFSIACKTNDFSTVIKCLSLPDFDVDFNEGSGLRGACRNGNLDIIKYLLTSSSLKKHASIHFKEKTFNSCLSLAILGNKLETIKFLLNFDPKQSLEIDDDTVLSWVAKLGHFDILKYFLTDPITKNKLNIHYNNDSVFLNAVKKSNLEIIKYLLYSPEIDDHINIKDFNGYIPYSGANLEVLQYLIEHGADPSSLSCDHCSEVVWEWLEPYQKSLKEKNLLSPTNKNSKNKINIL